METELQIERTHGRLCAGVVVTAIGLLLLAGCGGGGSGSKSTTSGAAPLSKAAYIKQMDTIRASLGTALNATESASSAKAAATALVSAQSGLRDAEKRIEAISPPAGVKTLHAKLAADFGEFADELDPVIAKLKAGNAGVLGIVVTLKGFRDISADARAITTAGYNITS